MLIKYAYIKMDKIVVWVLLHWPSWLTYGILSGDEFTLLLHWHELHGHAGGTRQHLGAIQVLRNAFSLEIEPPPTPS